jgi:prevent-host-death family protein
VHEAKTQLSHLLREVEDGSEIVITRGGKPVALLSRVSASADPAASLGMLRGQIRVADDFDADDEGIADLFGIPR